MKKRKLWSASKALLSIAVVALVVPLFIGTTAQAQDFGQLLAAVEKVEANLKAMIAGESSAREQAMEELRAELGQRPETGGAVSSEHWTALMNDIEFLKAEVVLLKGLTGENREQLASIDDDGFYEPPGEDPRVTELTEKLNELNASLEAMRAGQGTTSRPNPSVKHGKIALSAFVHEHFVSGPEETSSFVAKRARLTVKGDINEYAQIKIQGEFAKDPKLLDGQVTISPHHQWSFSIGQYKPPFGTDFLTSSTSTPFVNRSKASGLATNRDVGATISYRRKFNSDYSLKLTAGMFNGSGINTSDVNNNKNFVARAEATMGGMFTVAPNIYAGKTNEVDALKEKLVDFGSSLTWKWRHEIVEAEYIHSKHGDTKRQGWYVWGGHSFDLGLAFLKELQLLARYEQNDLDLDVDDNRTDRLTLGTTLFVDKKYTKIQFNYELNNEQGESVDNNEFLMNVQVAF